MAARITKRHATLLNGAPVGAFPGTNSAGNSIFRVRVGPLPRSSAISLCEQLRANRQDCFVVKKAN